MKFLIFVILATTYLMLPQPLLAQAPKCLRIEGKTYCPPSTEPEIGPCRDCKYCRGDIFTFTRADTEMSCRPCVCGVDCPPGPGGEGCGQKEFCEPKSCKLVQAECYRDVVTKPGIPNGKKCKCPPPPDGYQLCDKPQCRPDERCKI
ncbi:MAG: hypothetical protein IT289_08420 [Oligoflexia bacterium]|nr:hypothetical protein [Oligoflexia bacterium]